MVTDGPEKGRMAIMINPRDTWLDSKLAIRYMIRYQDFPGNYANIIKGVISHIEQVSCIRFQELSKWQPDSIYISGGDPNDPMCGADVGRRLHNGYQRLMLARNCLGPSSGFGIALHEMMHILGFIHEMSRPDRDSYVQVIWHNIPTDLKYNFDKWDDRTVDTMGLPYDYGSIMHYGARDFAMNRNYATINLLRSYNGKVGQRAGLSHYDILKLNKAYDCGGAGSLEVVPTRAPRPPIPRPPYPNYDPYWPYNPYPYYNPARDWMRPVNRGRNTLQERAGQ